MGRASIALKSRGGGPCLRSQGSSAPPTPPWRPHPGSTLQLDHVLGDVLGVQLLVIQRRPGTQCGLCDGKLLSNPYGGQWDPAQRGHGGGGGCAQCQDGLPPNSLGVGWAVHPGPGDQSARLLPRPPHALLFPAQTMPGRQCCVPSGPEP